MPPIQLCPQNTFIIPYPNIRGKMPPVQLCPQNIFIFSRTTACITSLSRCLVVATVKSSPLREFSFQNVVSASRSRIRSVSSTSPLFLMHHLRSLLPQKEELGNTKPRFCAKSVAYRFKRLAEDCVGTPFDAKTASAIPVTT